MGREFNLKLDNKKAILAYYKKVKNRVPKINDFNIFNIFDSEKIVNHY